MLFKLHNSLLSGGLDCQFAIYDVHDSHFPHPNPVNDENNDKNSNPQRKSKKEGPHIFKSLYAVSKATLTKEMEEQQRQMQQQPPQQQKKNAKVLAQPNPKDFHTSLISQISWYQSDNGMFFSSSFDETIRVWDTNTMKCAAIFELNGKVLSFAQQGFVDAASGTTPILAAAVDNSEKFVPIKKSQKATQQNLAPPIQKRFKVSHRSFLNEIALCDLRTGTSIHSLWGSKKPVWAVDFSPHDSRLLVSGDCEGKIRLWDIRKGGGWLAVFDSQNKKFNSTDYDMMMSQQSTADLDEEESDDDSSNSKSNVTPKPKKTKNFTLQHTPTMFLSPYKFRKPAHQRKKDIKNRVVEDIDKDVNYPTTGSPNSTDDEPVAHSRGSKITCVKFTPDGRFFF